jgi:hypothetical protein
MHFLVFFRGFEVFGCEVERLEAVSALHLLQERVCLVKEVQSVYEDDLDCTSHGRNV